MEVDSLVPSLTESMGEQELPSSRKIRFPMSFRIALMQDVAELLNRSRWVLIYSVALELYGVNNVDAGDKRFWASQFEAYLTSVCL
jgi:hypothetical protein